MLTFKEHIVKVGDKYRLVSKKTGKNLGTYDTEEGAEKRERQVQYFKRVAEENTQGDIGTDKLTKHRKKLTPGEKPKTPDMFPDWCGCENVENE